jgi:hypothetical protein
MFPRFLSSAWQDTNNSKIRTYDEKCNRRAASFGTTAERDYG